MRVSARTSYALRAVAELAVDATPVSLRDIARRQQIPYGFLTGIVATLRRAGIVARVPVGYALARPADQLTVADVLRALDVESVGATDRAPVPYEKTTGAGFGQAVDGVFRRLDETIAVFLEDVTVADLVHGAATPGPERP